MTRLINSLYIRMGTEKSVKHYKTFGITTLQNRHLEVKNNKLIFDFVGKHHVKHRKILVDKELAQIMQDLKTGFSRDDASYQFALYPNGNGEKRQTL